MTIYNELYDVVKRLQKEFPDLITLIPYTTFASDDVYEVMYSILNTAQERYSALYEEPLECEGCYRSTGVVYCETCYDDVAHDLHNANLEIDKLKNKVYTLERDLSHE